MFQMINVPSPTSPDSAHGFSKEPLVAPFRVIADIRERADGWRFSSLRGGADQKRPLIVPLVHRELEMAYYTVEGVAIYVVRRWADDFISALRQRPDSFVQESKHLCQLAASGASCVVIVEGDIESILQAFERHDSRPQDEPSAFESCDYGIPWLFAGSRHTAEFMAFEVMKRAWLRAQEH
jgi:hypothetical protein